MDEIFDENKPKVQLIKQAIQKTDMPTLQKILRSCQYGKEVNDVDSFKQTPIFYAGVHPREDFGLAVTDLLLKNGADPKHKDSISQNVLFYLAKQGKPKILRRLMIYKYNLNQNDSSRQTPIFFASVKNQLQCAQILIENGIDVNHLDCNNQNCLFYACRQGFLDMCKLLIKNGCNALHKDHKNDTPLKYAKMYRKNHLVQYLNSLKNDRKKVVIQAPLIKQQSSHNLESSRVFKQTKKQLRNDYLLVYTSQDGYVHQLTQQQLNQFAGFSEQNKKIIQFLQYPQKIDNQPVPPQKKFEKICIKILTYFWKQQNAHYFYQPVNYELMNLPDYPMIIKNPMDLGTIKTKLNFNAYSSAEQFKQDMLLVFQNCITYNSMNSALGKIALQMKMQFLANFKKDFPNIG